MASSNIQITRVNTPKLPREGARPHSQHCGTKAGVPATRPYFPITEFPARVARQTHAREIRIENGTFMRCYRHRTAVVPAIRRVGVLSALADDPFSARYDPFSAQRYCEIAEIPELPIVRCPESTADY